MKICKYGGVKYETKSNKRYQCRQIKDFYWLKEELQSFCRENGISASGSKIEITDRIEIFLRTGEIKKPIRKSKVNSKSVIGKPIGKYYDRDTGEYIETTRGMIHYGKDGAHIVPSEPLRKQ